MRRYAKALQTMLDTVENAPEVLKDIRASKGNIRAQVVRLVDKDLLRSLNEFHAQPFKDSLKIEFTNLLENYIKRSMKNSKAAFPRVTIGAEGLCEKLEEQGERRKSLNKLCDKLDSCKTVYFCRYSDCRDYTLLYDPYMKRFYAKLYLLSQHDENKIQPQKNPSSILQVVGKNKLLPVSNRPERFILVALSFGKEQEKLLLEALEKPEMLKTARLLKKDKEYYLKVNIALEPEAILDTRSFAGFCVSHDSNMSFTVCNHKGEIIHRGEIPCWDNVKPLPKAYDHLHILANAMTDVCYKYQAQAVLETYPRYNALVDLLDYKLRLRGAQKPVRVSPFGLWQTCPRCGHNSKKNSAMSDIFLCAACGFGLERTLLPSYNLAKRLIKYQNDKVRFYSEPSKNGHNLTIRNSLLDIEYPIGSHQNLDDFFEFVKVKTNQIREHLNNREVDWTKKDKKLFSVWNKLLTASDIREVIEIEA